MEHVTEIHHEHHHPYTPPLALTIVSCVFLALGALCFLVVATDIIWRRGWRSMMGVMIPVYPINAAYMLPLSVWLYFKHGRPAAPSDINARAGGHCHGSTEAAHEHEDTSPGGHSSHHTAEPPSSQHHNSRPDDTHDPPPLSHITSTADTEKAAPARGHHHSPTRPMLITVLAGVSHCGAGCVLGDLVGEWLIYGTGTTINNSTLWPALLVDYAFALLFGVAFQYFSIAPMSGEYGIKTVWRAFKADVLSLTSFEVGAFGWMVVYQLGIFGERLGMDTWVYWWMMQVGMAMGFATAVPVNWWLISKGVKEPCC